MNTELPLKNNVKDVRLDLNITQAELAETVGVSRNTIVSIENGRYCPSAKLALQICIALNKKFEELFFFENDESEKNGCPFPGSRIGCQRQCTRGKQFCT